MRQPRFTLFTLLVFVGLIGVAIGCLFNAIRLSVPYNWLSFMWGFAALIAAVATPFDRTIHGLFFGLVFSMLLGVAMLIYVVATFQWL